ncbi:anaerobic sulfatase maturase [Desulfovibrio sp. TomC]|uniref:anaerobic sulfatase maturase n=1 Tax=Desulfovibrio sp. TomC TaxID=1562888 RepID=UPI0005747F33|nr:anaerobic sulfatase maturase [Desulfovibrio sp. TomC]KHK03122.1 putative arylsulfatase regulatory protein [Desulfovibrio sp. TomC]
MGNHPPEKDAAGTFTRQGFTVMVKPAGPDCNLTCSYCFYRTKRRLFKDPHPRMGRRVVERFIKSYLELHPGPDVPFAWQGGEPLLAGLPFFEQVVRLARRHTPAGKRACQAVQTNATLIDRDFARFFAQNAFLVGVSLDGPAACHDAYRRRAGQPTHAEVMAGLTRLREHGVAYNILCAVHAANQEHPEDVYRFLRDAAGATFIQFIPIVADGAGSLCSASVTPAAFGSFLSRVWDVWRREDVGRVYVGHFDAALAAHLGQSGAICAMARDCGRALVLEHDGSLYACDHFVDETNYLGSLARQSLSELLASPVLAAFGAVKAATLPALCRQCPDLFACGGGCPKDRLQVAPPGALTAPYLCQGFKGFFRHAGPELAAMADVIRRQPAFRRVTDESAARRNAP